jgi:hypothetical protein
MNGVMPKKREFRPTQTMAPQYPVADESRCDEQPQLSRRGLLLSLGAFVGASTLTIAEEAFASRERPPKRRKKKKRRPKPGKRPRRPRPPTVTLGLVHSQGAAIDELND